MPLNTEVDYNSVVIKGTVELGVKGERGLQGFKGDQGIQGPPVPVAHELGDDPDLAVSQKLLTDSIADMEQSNEAAVMEATHQAGLAGDSAVIATEQAGIAASRAGESAQSAQAASGSALAAGQYASTATEQADIAAVKAGEASSSAADAATQAGLAADSEAAAKQAATTATTKADEASQSAQAAAQSATQAEEALDDKVDKVAGKQLSDENYTLAEKDKLSGVAVEATKNRDDSENADKLHTHAISDVTGLSAALLTKFDKTDVVQATGQSTEKVMSQKAVTDELDYLQRVAAGFDPFIGSYGLSHDGVADTYERVGSENFTAIQSMFRRCLLLPDGTVDYYLSPENSNYKADGTPANITGANGYLGNVMVQIPKYYRKITVDGDVATREVSLLPEEGFTLHPAFIKAGEEVDFRYYRAYQGVEIDGKLRSVSGAVPTLEKTIIEFRDLAKANGTDWHQTDWYVLDAVRELSSIEIGTYRSQVVIGQGNSTGVNYDLASGTSNEIGNGSSDSATSGWMSYRGIENFYASVWEFIDGINVRDFEPFVNGDHRTFESNVFTGDYVTAGVIQSGTNGYISAMAHTEKGFFITAATGSSSTFFADYYFQNTGNRIFVHGGITIYLFQNGSFCSNANYASVNKGASLGAGLAF